MPEKGFFMSFLHTAFFQQSAIRHGNPRCSFDRGHVRFSIQGFGIDSFQPDLLIKKKCFRFLLK